MSPRFYNEPTKIGHIQNSESIFEVKYLHNLPENDFLFLKLEKLFLSQSSLISFTFD